MNDHGEPLTFQKPITKFEDIPDIRTLDVPPIEWFVPELLARNTLTLWAGQDGTAKTYLVEKLAVECARGGTFLGRKCRETPVLFLDFENPAFAVKDRIDILCGELSDSLPNLRIWGTWCDSQPPKVGSPLLYTIATELHGIIIIDPFRYSHDSDENDSAKMAVVMGYLRDCAKCGNAVVILHHVGKAEGSTGRGSSAVRAACDHGLLQEITEDSSIVTLKTTKNRFGPRHCITIRANFDEGTFERSDSVEFTKRTVEQDRLQKIIETDQGLPQTEICNRSNMMKTHAMRLLKEGDGVLWEARPEGRSIRYYSLNSNLITIPSEKVNGASGA